MDTIIRSSYCAADVLGGVRIMIIDEGNKFLVATKWQNIGRRKDINEAIALFERTAMGDDHVS